MTKVEHTKTHIRVAYRDKDMHLIKAANVLVTDAKLVLVECKCSDGLFAREGNGKLHIIPNKPTIPSVEQFNINKATLPVSWRKPILISETEKIEVGDWFYRVESPAAELTQATELLIKLINEGKIPDAKKVLALPEHFSPEQLQMIVGGKPKEGKCLVECENKPVFVNGEEFFDYKIKLNPHITIYPFEEKMYTRDEVITLLIKFDREYFEYTKKYGRSNLSTWLKLNDLGKM